MAETLADDYQWESDEADWESDEALAGESDESVEDIGERTRETRRRSRYRPTQGVQGIRLRRPDGVSQTVKFPAKLPTTAEVNRGLASQEMGRRALEEKLGKLEKQFGRQVKNDAAITGLVTLGIGGGLTAYGAVKAAEEPTDKFQNWTNQGSTTMASLVSAAQLATTGAKWATSGRYHRSGLGMAADIFSVAQLATFVLGTFSSSNGILSQSTFNKVAHNYTGALKALDDKDYVAGDVVAIDGLGHYLRVSTGANGTLFFERA
jgi:hypothetical protein